MRPIWVNGAAVAILFAMATFVATTAKAPQQAPRSESLTSILERIRQDVGYYEVQAALWRGDLPGQTQDRALTTPGYVDPPDSEHPTGLVHPARTIDAKCPIDRYDFDVTKVEVTVQVVEGSTVSGDVGLKVPYTGSDLSMSTARQMTATKTLVLDRDAKYEIDKFEEFSNSDDYQRLVTGHQSYLQQRAGLAQSDAMPTTAPVFPISQTLLSLRQNLVEAAEKVPCFEIPEGASANTIKLDFQVSQSSNRDIGFTLEIVSAKLAGSQQQSAENTITVTYAPHTKTSHEGSGR
jgi:hypothetical protein